MNEPMRFDVEDFAEELGARLVRRQVAHDAGRIDQPADEPEPVHDLVEGGAEVVLVSDVGGQEDRVLVGEGALC